MAYNVSSALAAKGHDVRVVTSNLVTANERTSLEPTESIINGVRVHYLPTLLPKLAWKYKFTLTPALSSWIRQSNWKPDIMHFHEVRSYPARVLSMYEPWSDVPVVTSPHGAISYEHGSPHLKRLFDLVLLQPIVRRTTVWHALTDKEATEIRTRYPEGDVRVLSNGVSVPDEVIERKEASRDILYLGRIYHRKRVDRLISALALVNDPTIRLRIVGPDDGAQKELEALASQLGVSSRVIWEGLVTEKRKAEILANRPIFALTSDGEGMPMSVLEAMAYGCPCILTPDAANPTIREANAAKIVEPNAESIARAVCELTRDVAGAEGFGERARSVTSAHFGIEATAERFERLYRGVIQ